jgi:hypothetical protein
MPPKPMTNSMSKGRFGKLDFVYVGADDIYLCPAGERLSYRYTNEEDGKTLRRYWTTNTAPDAVATDLRLHIGTTIRNDSPVRFAKVCVGARADTAVMSRCRMFVAGQTPPK